MILEILLIILLFTVVFILPLPTFLKEKLIFQNNKHSPEDRQQKCGMTVVNENGKNTLIHTGCSVDRKATFSDSMPGESPFGEDGFVWDNENGLFGQEAMNGYE